MLRSRRQFPSTTESIEPPHFGTKNFFVLNRLIARLIAMFSYELNFQILQVLDESAMLKRYRKEINELKKKLEKVSDAFFQEVKVISIIK
jgi:hypothetical protein